MFVYSTIPAAQDSLSAVGAMYTTNGTANTISTHLYFLTAAGRPGWIQGLYLIGRGAGLTAISGIMLRLMNTATAGTAGTAATPHPRDTSAPAAITTVSTAPTLGTGAVTSKLVVGCGAAGPGGWVSPNPDSGVYMAAGGTAPNGTLYICSGSGTVSLGFDLTVEHFE